MNIGTNIRNWSWNRKAVSVLLIISVLLVGVYYAFPGTVDAGKSVFTLATPVSAAGVADVTADGTNDNVDLQTLVTALPAAGGRVSVLTGTYAWAALANVTRAIGNVTIDGTGYGTYVDSDGVTAPVTAGGNNWVISNMRFDAPGPNMGATTGWEWINVWVGATHYAYWSESGNVRSDTFQSDIATGTAPLTVTSTTKVTNLNTDTVDGYQAARTVTYVVAANDAPANVKAQADYVCDGTADEAQIITAMGTGNVNIQLSPGTFNIDNEIRTAAIGKRFVDNVAILGSGIGITTLINRMDGGGINDKYLITVYGENAGNPVYNFSISNLTMQGQEYLVNTKGQHGIGVKYTDGLFIDNVETTDMSEEGFAIADGVINVDCGRLVGSRLGSAVLDIGGGAHNLTFNSVSSYLANQVEATGAVNINYSLVVGGEPYNIQIGTIRSVYPGSGAAGLLINSAYNISVGDVQVTGETAANKTGCGIKIAKGGTGARSTNINIGSATLINCGANANQTTLDVGASDYVNLSNIIIQGHYGIGARFGATTVTNVDNLTIRDNFDGTAFSQFSLEGDAANITNLTIIGVGYTVGNGNGIYISGDDNKITGFHVSGVDSWAINVAAAADNTQITQGAISGTAGMVSNSGTNIKIKGVDGYIAPGEVRTASGSLTKTGSTLTTVTGTFTESVATLLPGANTLHCTVNGTANVVIPVGSVGVAASVGGGATVATSPVTLPAGTTLITVTAGGTNEFTVTVTAIGFAWHNPEAQDVFVKKVVLNITTKGGTATSEIEVGIADDAVATNRGTEFFNALDADAAAILHDSWLAGGVDFGTQTKWVLLQDSASATDGWVVGSILTEIADNLVGSWYVEYVGK